MPSATEIPARFLSILDFDHETLGACLERAAQYKAARAVGVYDQKVLKHRHVALLFEKPSLRTRSTFQIAVRELGGDVIEPGTDVALGGRESIADVARNLERWVFAAVIRTYGQDKLAEFAAAAPRLRVLNALTNEEHPCQALADCLTLQQAWGSLKGRTIAFVGDGNNVATSLAHAAVMLGAHVRVASPEGFGLPDRVVNDVARIARAGGSLECVIDPVDAVRGADAVYTDVWTSMGQEASRRAREEAFQGYSVDGDLMRLAKADAIFMHDLPAHRGEEVQEEVIDGAQSVIFDQAENRLHAQKALLAAIMADAGAL